MYKEVTLCSISLAYAVEESNWTFPDNFVIGVASSAHQVEGAWDIKGKGENIWDRFTHTAPHKIKDASNADIACDSYHKFKEDVRLIKEMGLDFYRFSLSWARILPNGHSNVVSEDGIRYYNDLIDELKRNNIEPFVTIYHWDHPQVLQELGGWTNDVIVDWFGDYARVVFREFGDRVKMFSTINEPYEFCRQGFGTGMFAPGLALGNEAQYLCAHNAIKAHARAYHIYNNEFRAQQNGKIGIVLNSLFYYPKYENDTTSSEIALEFMLGKYANPIFSKEGDYPAIVKQMVAENSKYEGLERSRLPVFSPEWIKYIRGTSDFLGLNHYTSNLVEPAPKVNYTIYPNDHGLIYSYDKNWPSTASAWLKVVPQGLADLLIKIKEKYGNLPVYVTENGPSDNGTLIDDQRIEYLHSYMKSILTAIKVHGCDVRGYTVWSLLDNFEWNKGYTEKFGMIHVDFNHPNKTRTPKKSVYWLKSVLSTRKLQPIEQINDPSLV